MRVHSVRGSVLAEVKALADVKVATLEVPP